MYSRSFPLSHYDVLSRYRLTLQQAVETTERIKSDFGLRSNAAFMQLHEPSLEHIFIQARGQLANWPDLLQWPYKVFYQQSDLAVDIMRSHSSLNAVIATMPLSERKGFLSTLDFARAPFELNGQLKILKPTLGLPFARQVKQCVEQLWLEYDRGAFTLKDLYPRASVVIPRLIDFMQGAINAYAAANNLDPTGTDRKLVAVRLMIDNMKADHLKLADAVRDLSEGYSQLAYLLSGSAGQLTDLFTTITIQQFQQKLESASTYLELAEAAVKPAP